MVTKTKNGITMKKITAKNITFKNVTSKKTRQNGGAIQFRKF